ncbi:transcription factor bHLH123-like isoform X1 [Cucurbita pepo subsp. pepo]|uniref:transcription factor bHLH123-like isoform X1 n=1 Tax=Cucurbita pepo subsp. pepo TaxID=3664 RepID=UPI000C9D2FBE|nr:transcription factor bHLH123-like isoform X1 [Cucurbita pepo subsp. pepo]
MAEEFQSSGNWWEASRSRYEAGISPSSSAAAADPNLHITGLALDWNQPLLGGGEKAAEGSFRSMMQPDNMNLNMLQETEQQQQQQIEWMRSEKGINRGFSLDHHHQQFASPSHYSSTDSAVTSFPIDTTTAATTLYGNSTTLLQGLLGGEQQQVSAAASMNYPYNSHYGINSNEFMAAGASWSPSTKLPQFLRNSTPHNQLQFSNNTAFWNASDMKDVRPSYVPTSYNTIPEKSKNRSEIGDSISVGKKSGNDGNQQQSGGGKRGRNESPSTLPAFKVRKEKMGDRITALQQLVSPFGKTDTASVLSEAIEYIKFLHEQVGVLSTPYLKSRSDKWKEGEGEEDLRSRGLCLVPVSSTFPVTHDTTVDFWTPTFGGTFR